MNSIEKILNDIGPSRSSIVAKKLTESDKISEVTARQRLSRAHDPIMKFPILLLPNRENFVYLKNQRKTEQFWDNFLKALRDTNSVYAAAIDALTNRGSTVEAAEFPVISGAPIALKKQVTSDIVIRNLSDAGIIEKYNDGEKEYISLTRLELMNNGIYNHKILRLTENIILDGLREWARKLGMASYDKITIRGDAEKRLVGPFMWDLTGPSYILPLRGEKSALGFLVADVFSQGILKEKDIKYFIRKTKILQASVKNIKFIPILVAEGFDSTALKYGKGAGAILASTTNIFGYSVAQSMKTLIQTLDKAAAIAIGNPDKLLRLLNDLSPIEGAAGNLRGILFELICVYLANIKASSVDHSVIATDPKTGRKAEIDVLRIVSKGECTAIECKGKAPGGTVDETEVKNWIDRLVIFRSHIKEQSRFRDAKITFEIWTTGTFSDKALELLNKEKNERTKNPIAWKDGSDVLKISKEGKEKGITEALKEHYFNHPLNS